MRYKLIMVKDSRGKTVKSFAPNNIGETEQELLQMARSIARIVGGTVKTIEADR